MKKFRRQMVSGVLALSMLATMLPIPAFAAEDSELPIEAESLVLAESLQQDSTEEKIQSSVEPSTDSPHILSETEIAYPVEGGNIYFDTATGTITDCDEEVTKIEIPGIIEGVSVTSIGDKAFYHCSRLPSIIIPDSITAIGYGAFQRCSGLRNVTIGDGVDIIEDETFDTCQYLTSVTIGSNVTSIGNKAFYSCSSLTNVTIPDSVTFIGDEAFAQCWDLTNVAIPNSVTSIGDEAFFNCSSLTGVTIPNSIIAIGDSAFYSCDQLTDVTILDGMTSIGNSVFEDCINLANVAIPNSVTSIGNSAFKNCTSLTSVTIPNSVTIIGDEAFYGCDCLPSVTIPDNVISVGRYAFGYCTDLTSVTIGNSVKSIETAAFAGCSGLTNVTIPDSVTTLGGSDYPAPGAFGGCSGLTTVTIGDGLTDIGSGVFSGCDSLSQVTIGGTYIAKRMFSGLTNLTKVIIGDGVTSIEDGAFYGCTGLTSIAIPGNVTTIKGSEYYYGGGAFEGCSNLISVTIGDGVKSLGGGAFYDCVGLTSVTIPNSVTDIGVSAFSGCTGLTSMTIPDSVTNIGSSAFSGCTGLTSVTIGDGLEECGSNVFSGCNNLSQVVIGGTYIANNMFSGLESLTSVTIGDGVKSIGEGAFYGCTGLTNMTIPGSVTSINGSNYYHSGVAPCGGGAFENCSNLTKIIIERGVKSIAHYVFDGCDALSDIYYSGSESDWNAINKALTNATIHYNSIGPDDPEVGSEISYVAGILKSYDPQTQEIFFEYYDGINETYEYKVTDQTEVENWDTLIGQPVLVSYILTGILSGSVVAVQPAEIKVGTVEAVTDSTITLNGEVFNLKLKDLFGLDYYVGETVVCYIDNDVVVNIKKLEKKTGVLNAGSNTSVTIDGFKYVAIFDGIPPYLSAPELWFEQEVEYYYYDNGANKFIFEVSLKPYSSIFTQKLTKWEGTTVTFEDGTIRQTAQDVVFDATLIGKWVDCTIGTTADGGNVITSIVLAKPTYRTDVKKLIAWNEGNPQFSDGTTMGVFIVGNQYDPAMIGRWVKLTIEDCLNTGTKITGISLAEPSSNSDFQLIHSTNIYLKDDQYSFDGQNYEDSSKFEIEFKIFIQNIVEDVSDINLSEMKKDTSMNLTVEDIEITEPDGFNFGWTGSGAVGDVKGLAVPAGEVREVTGFIRPGMFYFVDEKEVTETIACKIVLSNGDVFEKELLFTIHNLDYKEPSTGGDDVDGEEENIEFTSWEKGLLSEFYKAKDIDVTMQSGNYSLLNYFDDDIVDDISKTVSVWAGILKTDLAEETKGTLPIYLKINASMNKDNDMHAATIIFKYNNLYGSSYASLNYISFVLKDNKTGRTLISDGLFSASSSASFRNFADGVNEYLKVKYGEETKDFCKKIMKDAISDSIKDFSNITGSQYVSTMLEVLTQFDELKGYIDQSKDILQNPIQAEISSLKEFNDIAAKRASIRCPVDVWVYNKDNVLCGKIENNSITYDTHEVFMYVENDEKTVWFSDDIHFKLISTDIGSMDYDIMEYKDGEASRRVGFQNVPLRTGISYTADAPIENSLPAAVYVLTSNNGVEVEVSEDVDLIESGSGGTGGGGGSGSTTPTSYTITAGDTVGGAITINPKASSKGQTVTITAVPDNGFILEMLSVSDKNGNKIELTQKNETSYTFKMPASNVTVSATFAEIVVEPEPVVLPFDDISQSVWYYGAVEYVYSNNMMQGTSATTFSPQTEMNRGMIATVLYRLENKPTHTGSISFSDVRVNEWYTDAIQWAAENSIMNGYGNNLFGPIENVTREQLALILYNYTAFKGISVTTEGDLSVFCDAQNTSVWAEEAISWAVGVGLLSGKGNGILDPTGTATRAEVAQMLMNYCTKVA